MLPQPNRIVFATEQPLLIAGLRELLRHAGLTGDLSVIVPEALNQNLRPDEACLVILEGELQRSWECIVEARRKALDSRFVLLAAEITPRLIYAVLEAGLHGVIATTLPLEDASQALVRICSGERHFRFEGQIGGLSPARLADSVTLPVWAHRKEVAA